MKNALGAMTPFLFNSDSLSNIEKELSNFNSKKPPTYKNIPATILKISKNSF